MIYFRKSYLWHLWWVGFFKRYAPLKVRKILTHHKCRTKGSLKINNHYVKWRTWSGNRKKASLLLIHDLGDCTECPMLVIEHSVLKGGSYGAQCKLTRTFCYKQEAPTEPFAGK